MGQSLSEPKIEKNTEKFEDGLFCVGSSSMQGWRLEMEDAHSVQLGFVGDPESAYFAVFDGHGGAKFANHCSSHLSNYLERDPAFKNRDYGTALRNSFLSIDNTLQRDLRMQNEQGGTTAIVSLVKDNKIYCANAGDSRAVACIGGRVQELSHDHKPYNQGEESRISKAGGWVEFNRVNGNLALSRAIGDFNFKSNPVLSQAEQIVTADPEIITIDLTPDHEFIVIACDGIWDVMSNVEVAEFIRKKLASNLRPPLICEALLDHCLAPDCRMGGVGCDNMTVILVCFLHGESFGDLVYRCSRNSVQISRARRFSSIGGSIEERQKTVTTNRSRRLSEPLSLHDQSPVLPSKLTDRTSFTINSRSLSEPNRERTDEIKEEEEEEEEEGEEEEEEEEVEDEEDEFTHLPIRYETTL